MPAITTTTTITPTNRGQASFPPRLRQRPPQPNPHSSWPGLPAFAEAKLGFAQAGPGHPRFLVKPDLKDVDARHKAGHDRF